jgi:proline iminopeptidase
MDVPGRLVEIRGTRLHVMEAGDPAAPALLFVHGGPGQGAYDFFHHQRDLLSKDVRLVGVDHRGSLFSDPLRDGELVSETETVADLEAVREALGIDRWAVLGHSFGTRMALRYAVQHPEQTTAALFENPVWDNSRSSIDQIEATLAIQERMGIDTAAARALLAQPEPITSDQRLSVVGTLGEAEMVLWFHAPERLSGNPFASMELAPDILERSQGPSMQLLRHEQLTQPLTSLLTELSLPSLLLLGLYDCVSDDDTIELFNARVDLGEVAWFEESGHFCHMEEPQAYADVVREFVARA